MDFRRPNGNLDPAVGGITACGDSDPAPLPVGAADKTVTATAATAVGDIERNRMVDSVRAWVRLTADLWMKADSVGLMEQYLNEDSLVSVTQGVPTVARDSIEHMLDGIAKTSNRHIDVQIHRIDVLAPGIAALTMSFHFQGNDPDKKHFDSQGIYSAVAAERD
jgi:ketosteroid isomerase-like protein